MKARILGLPMALVLAMCLALPMAAMVAASPSPPTIQLAVLLDGSISIDLIEWNTQITGLSDAILEPDCIPHDGSVELTVIQFGGHLTSTDPPSYTPGAKVYVSRVPITDDSVANSLADTVNTTVRNDKFEGSTPLHEGIIAAVGQIGGANAIAGARQVINISTDGGTDRLLGLPRYLAEQARDAAIDAYIDEISAEGIGSIQGYSSSVNWLRDRIVYPGYPGGSGKIAPPFPSEEFGWVYLGSNTTNGVQSPLEFKTAICHKVESAPVPIQYALTTKVNPLGSGSVSPSGGVYDPGTEVTLTATANAGWVFDHWGGDASGTSNPTTITMDSDKSVTAYFVQSSPQQYTLTTNVNPSGSGSVSLDPPGGVYDPGTEVTLQAVPVSSYFFLDWGGDISESQKTENPITIIMDSDKIVIASFARTRGCFIATAAYGSHMDSSVDTLRAFRDGHMVNNPVGRSLVSTYYELSPRVAQFIDDHPALKPVARAVLLPAVAMSEVAVGTTLAGKLAIAGSLVTIGALAAIWLRRKAGLG